MKVKKQSKWIVGLLGLFLWVAVPLGVAAELKDQPQGLQTFVQKENLTHAGISFHAIDLSTGETVAAYNEDTALIPASTMKVVTSAAALELLGPDYVFQTKLFYDGKIDKKGVLKGNLYIQGMGDPTLGSDGIAREKEAFLEEWLDGMRKEGIKSVAGDIIVLDQLFGYEGVPGKWLWEDFGTDYAAGTYGISVFDNLYTLYLKSGSAGTTPVILRTEPAMPKLQFENHTITSVENNGDPYVRGVPFANKRSIHGDIPEKQEAFAIKSDIPDPGLFLAEYFSGYLKENGIKIKGEATTARLSSQRPKSETLLAVTESVPLSEIVSVLLSRSDNHYAEHLFQITQTEKGMTISEFWKNKGLNTNPLSMKDGSGLSPQDTVSARFLTDVLTYMNHENGLSANYKSLFPVAGKDGTVASFLKNTPLDGKAYIKSGSMSGIQSYAGYIEKDGKDYAFALVVNHWNGSRAELRTYMEKLLIDVFAPAQAVKKPA